MLVFGTRPVEEVFANAPGSVRRLFVSDPRKAPAGATGVRVEVLSRQELDDLCGGGNHQGVAIDVGEFQYATLGELIDASPSDAACIVVLDQVQDPHNLGAILRSAAAFGVVGVVVPKDRAAAVTASVVRASAGLALSVPVARVTNVARTLQELREHGFWTVGAVMDDAAPIAEIDLAMRAAVVLGGEGTGIRRLVQKHLDFRARIPMAEGIDSLNVSVAAAVFMYEFRRQNSGSGG